MTKSGSHSVPDGESGVVTVSVVDAVNLDQVLSPEHLRAVFGNEDADAALESSRVVPEAETSPSVDLSTRHAIGPVPEAVVGHRPGFQDLLGSIDDGYNEQPLGEFLAYHDRLLRKGWRPTRWRHPEKGELELVVSDGCWIARTAEGDLFHHFRSDRCAAAFRVGRTKFSRDADGNLVLVIPEDIG